MFDVASQGGSVDRPAGGFPSRSILSWVVLGCALLWWPAARAGVLYRCTGVSGEAVFSSSKAGYHGCKAISTYAAPARHKRTPPAARASLTGVTGSVATTARDLTPRGTEATSLTRVRGTVETSAQRIGETPERHASLARYAVRPRPPPNFRWRLRPPERPVNGSIVNRTTRQHRRRR